MLDPGARVFPTGRVTTASRAGLGQFTALWERFVIPTGHAMRPGIEAACAAFAPHVLVSDALAIAGGLVARRRRIVWASSAPGPAEFAQESWVPVARAWVRSRMDEFQATYGVTDAVDLRFSPDLVLAFTTAEFMGAEFPPPLALVGAGAPSGPAGPDLPLGMARPGATPRPRVPGHRERRCLAAALAAGPGSNRGACRRAPAHLRCAAGDDPPPPGPYPRTEARPAGATARTSSTRTDGRSTSTRSSPTAATTPCARPRARPAPGRRPPPPRPAVQCPTRRARRGWHPGAVPPARELVAFTSCADGLAVAICLGRAPAQV